MAVISQDLYSKSVEVINNNLYDFGISIDDKKTKGSYIYLECEEDRSDTRSSLEMELENISGITCSRKYIKSRSSMDMTEISGFGDNLFLVYKDRKGGMKETTLNASITELFPAIAFEKKISPRLLTDKFYNEIVSAHDPKLHVYKNKTASDAGKDTIDRASSSSKFEDKVENAKAITRFLIEENKRKKINKVVWGYRNNTKPTGVSPNHKGDIFLVFDDGNILGVSLKAGSASSAEPQFNSYVRPIFTSFKKLPDFAKLQKTSYNLFYKGIPNIPKESMYGKSQMTKVVGAFENSNIKRYEALYDEQLKFVRQYLCNMMNQYPKKAKQWLLSEVAAEQEDVPLIVVKAANDTIKIIDDENVIKDCVQTSKKINGIKAYPSKTSKQNWHIDLTCRTHTTTLNFSIRTNKTGINHKLGQYVNLAVKFNGLKKK
jgi:hypothetical protein